MNTMFGGRGESAVAAWRLRREQNSKPIISLGSGRK
jgi:hypothetical protein